jgi:hypothetical protein
MKHLRGFRKRYFRLASIVAYSTASKIQANDTISKYLFINRFELTDDEEEDEDPPIQTALFAQNAKVCRCAKAYKQKARLALLLNHFIPRCPYYTTWYAFRRTGVHPPF